jgi:hypothetical protein
MSKTQSSKPENYPPLWKVNMIGIFYMILIIFLGILAYMLWPQYDANKAYLSKANIFNIDLDLSFEQRTIILVLITGAIGSFIHSAGSFTNYVGEQKITSTWIWWYILRPFVGIAVAFVFYLVIRGGMLTNTNAEDLNVYGILTMSALAGLFSDRATLKLKEVFETLFKPKDDRSDKLKSEDESS